jgi:dGTPase
MNIREMLQRQEEMTLAPCAAFSSKSKGRLFDAPECEIRPVYQHDRDSIIHCKSFRRLKHKTQVFLSPSGDHYRTRLTHTLEVSQIARTIAKSLRLNEDLTEAIALGHDLGHTPFGHAGEAVLNKIHSGGFKHEEQSLRVVDILERDGKGLNLTHEVRDGIVKHSKGERAMFPQNESELACTLEGQIVRLADIIAYVNHDIDDALRAGIISGKDLPADCLDVLGHTHSRRINTMVTDIIYNSQDKLPQLSMSKQVLWAIEKLRRFLTERVYYNEQTYGEFKKAYKIVEELYYYFVEHPERMLSESRLEGEEDRMRLACDFIAGMTDRYALKIYEQIFLPQPWLVM